MLFPCWQRSLTRCAGRCFVDWQTASRVSVISKRSPGRHRTRARRRDPRLGAGGPVQQNAGPGATFGIVIAVAIGIPLYSNAAGILPLIEALYDKAALCSRS